jgi:tetratricopeptide (TPR) repeat protein
MSGKKTQQLRVRMLLKQAAKLTLNQGNPDECLTLLLEAFSVDPLNVDVNLALAEHYQDQNNYDKTEEHLLKALPYTDDRPFLFEKLAFLYLSNQQLSKAKMSAIRGLEEEPDCIELQTLLTDICLKLKDYEAAAASAWRENELSDQEYEPIAIVSMAKALDALHRTDEAAIALNNAIIKRRSQDSPYDISYYFLASLMARSGNTERAYELILEGLNSGNFEPSKDDFETQLYLTAARVCASHNDPLNHARFLIRADLNTDAPLTHIEELTAALKQCKPQQKLLARLKIDFPSSAYAKQKNTAIANLITNIEQLNQTSL